jgi:hypothetical protein
MLLYTYYIYIAISSDKSVWVMDTVYILLFSYCNDTNNI